MLKDKKQLDADHFRVMAVTRPAKSENLLYLVSTLT